jgi:hypothetical protein
LFIFKDKKADVILKYNANEVRSLKAYGELPEHGNVYSVTKCCHVLLWFLRDNMRGFGRIGSVVCYKILSMVAF